MKTEEIFLRLLRMLIYVELIVLIIVWFRVITEVLLSRFCYTVFPPN